MLVVAEPFVSRNMHPTVIVRAYYKALDEALRICESMAIDIDLENTSQMLGLVRSCVGTKFTSRFGDLLVDMAIKAVMRVTVVDKDTGRKDIDIKRYARVEKVWEAELVIRELCAEGGGADPRRRTGGLPRYGWNHAQQRYHPRKGTLP